MSCYQHMWDTWGSRLGWIKAPVRPEKMYPKSWPHQLEFLSIL